MIFVVFLLLAYGVCHITFASKKSFLIFCGTLFAFTEGRLLLLVLGFVVGILFVKESYIYIRKGRSI